MLSLSQWACFCATRHRRVERPFVNSRQATSLNHLGYGQERHSCGRQLHIRFGLQLRSFLKTQVVMQR